MTVFSRTLLKILLCFYQFIFHRLPWCYLSPKLTTHMYSNIHFTQEKPKLVGSAKRLRWIQIPFPTENIFDRQTLDRLSSMTGQRLRNSEHYSMYWTHYSLLFDLSYLHAVPLQPLCYPVPGGKTIACFPINLGPPLTCQQLLIFPSFRYIRSTTKRKKFTSCALLKMLHF